MTRKISIIFWQELRILFKDRQALGLLFVMPLAFILFLTLALQDVYQAKVIGKKITLDVITNSPCLEAKDLCTQLVGELQRLRYSVRVQTVLPADERDVQIALVLPPNLKAVLEDLQEHGAKSLNETNRIELIFDPLLDQALRALVQGHFLLALQTVLIEQMSEMPGGVGRFDGLVVERARGGLVLPNPIQQTVPAWALFGMFFIVIPLSNSMIRDRRLGIFKRLLSFPVSRGHLIVGKIMPFFLINILQFAIMFGAGLFVLPHFTNLHLELNFNGWGVIAVTVACALAASSYGLMVSCLTRTSEQASAFGALSVVILAILGGIMIPRLIMPDFMQTVAKVSPLYWGLEAYHDVIVRHSAWTITADKIAVLLVFSLVCGGVSLWRFSWHEVH